MVACRKIAVYLRPVYHFTTLITGGMEKARPEVNVWEQPNAKNKQVPCLGLEE
jgi:hypothetical protein